MSTSRLLLVRHGQSTWNAVRRWQGSADPPLSDLGEEQARKAAAGAVKAGTFAEVVTSTLARARRTGELLAAGMDIDLGAAVSSVSERSAGEWEGLTRVEIDEQYPGFLADGRRPPGYEPDADVIARVTDALLAIIDPARSPQGRSGDLPETTRSPQGRSGDLSETTRSPQGRSGDLSETTRSPQGRSGDLLVVTHGGVINALERHADEEWRRLDNLEGRWFEVDTAAGRVVPVGDRVHLLGAADRSEAVDARDDDAGRSYA